MSKTTAIEADILAVINDSKFTAEQKADTIADWLLDAADIVADMYENSECWYDHHGYCQEHGWFETDPVCPNKRAKELLAWRDRL